MQYVNEWIDSLIIQNLSGTTIKSYKESVIFFLDYIKTEIEEIEPSDILSFIAYRGGEGISKGTVIKNIAGIKSFYKFLVEKKYIVSDPTLDIKIKKDPRRLPRFHSVETMNQVLDNTVPENPKYSKNWLRDLALVEIAYSSGLRLAELHNLKIKNVDQRRMLIKIIGKGNKQRIVPVGTKAIKALNKWLKIRRSIMEKNKTEQHEYIFTTTKGKQLSRTQINTRIKHLFKINGITEKSNPHVLRHSFATHLINANVGIRDIQVMLGHENLNTTQIYTFVDTNTMNREYSKAHPRANKKDKDLE